MSATSTTSPVTENTNEDREIQNALDKKRKKRIQHNNNNRDFKHPRVEGHIITRYHYYTVLWSVQVLHQQFGPPPLHQHCQRKP